MNVETHFIEFFRLWRRKRDKAVYDYNFFSARHSRVYIYAMKILSRLFEVTRIPDSSLDFGSATGAWSEAAKSLGVRQCICVDGDWVPNALISKSVDLFVKTNLEVPDYSELEDLAYQWNRMGFLIEVCEHLSVRAADVLIGKLTDLCGIIVFSAAYPGQGGIGHINEAHLSFWEVFFRLRGYKSADVLRPSLWNDSELPIFYRQNIVVFFREDSPWEGFMRDFETPARPMIHPEVYDQLRARHLKKSFPRGWRK